MTDIFKYHQGPVVCRVCRRGLEHEVTLRETGTLERWVHNRSQRADHDPEPVGLADHADQVSVCDFCFDANPVWEWPCESFEHEMPARPNGSTQSYGSVEAWVSCDPCHDLIVMADWQGVWQRWLDHHRREVQGASPRQRREMRDFIVTYWEAFSNHRTDDPFLLVGGRLPADPDNVS